MNAAVLFRFLGALLAAGAIAFRIYQQDEWETVSWTPDRPRERYSPFIQPLFLLLYLPVFLAADWVIWGAEEAAHFLLAICLPVFLHASVFYVLLIPALPLLRKWISAKACAFLWLLPNFLYLMTYACMIPSAPRWVLSLPDGWGKILTILWAAGFCAVLLWKIIGHLVFRRQLLKDARAVTDPAVLAVWAREQQRAGLKKPIYQLAVSPVLQTPLSIGFFKRSVRVMLPEQNYSADDLTLIFRHELVHIGRQDSCAKFFLAFCTAMCWFNPLMWLAMRKSAEDLELSCDETVLLEADAETRRRYAELLLRTAGDGRGFTTCLSASVAAMRYRLKNVVAPRERCLGGLALGLAFVLLIMSCGHVALAYETGSGQDYIFSSGSLDAYSISSIGFCWQGSESPSGSYTCADEAALTAYLAGLSFSKIAGNYDYDDDISTAEPRLIVFYNGPDGSFAAELQDEILTIVPLHSHKRTSGYIPKNAIDWAYLDSLLAPKEHVERSEASR